MPAHVPEVTPARRQLDEMKRNPYGVLPAIAAAAPSVIPAIPYILPAVLGAGVVWYVMSDKEPKKATPMGSLFSAPVLIGGGLGWTIGSIAKLETGTRVALTGIGVGAGWIFQHKIIAPEEYEQSYRQQKKEEKEEYRWYKPWTW